MGTQPVGTSIQIYRRELYQQERFTREQEQYLITRARAGDRVARTELIEGCLRYVLAIATYYKSFLFRDEVADLIGIGNLAMIESVEKALTKENPVGYLQGCAKRAIMSHVYHQPQADLYTLEEKYHELVEEAPVARPSYDWLYHALDTLKPQQKEVVYAHFGLGDTPKESLYQRSLQRSPSPKGSSAYLMMYRALHKLRQLVQTTEQGEVK